MKTEPDAGAEEHEDQQRSRPRSAICGLGPVIGWITNIHDEGPYKNNTGPCGNCERIKENQPSHYLYIEVIGNGGYPPPKKHLILVGEGDSEMTQGGVER